MYAPLILHVSHAGETSGTGSWHHPFGRRRRRYDQPTAIRRHQIHGTGEPHCRVHFIRLFHVRDPIQGAGRLSGICISRDRCHRLPHSYGMAHSYSAVEWRDRASAACSRQLAVAPCASAQHSGHICPRASTDGLAPDALETSLPQSSTVFHVISSEVTRTVSLMCPCPLPAVSGLARPAGVSLRRLAQRSKICPTFAGRSAGHTVLKCTRVACRASTLDACR